MSQMGKKPSPKMTMADLSDLAIKLVGSDTPDAAFAAVAAAAQTFIGHKLFTIMVFDESAMQVQRVYSDNPKAYPSGGRKAKQDTNWGRHVLEEGRPFIGYNREDIRTNFDDFDVIFELGLESVLNIPIRVCGRTIGTMNLLHDEGFYGESDLECGTLLAGQLIGPICIHSSL